MGVAANSTWRYLIALSVLNSLGQVWLCAPNLQCFVLLVAGPFGSYIFCRMCFLFGRMSRKRNIFAVGVHDA